MSNPKYKYQFTVDGKTYDVSKENIDKYGWDGYAESYPDAKIRMRDDEGADYDVPIGRLETMQRNGLHPFITRYDASEPQEKVPEGSQTDSSDNGQLLSKPWIPDSQQKAAITANLGGISRSARQTVDDFAERVDKDNHPQTFGPRVSITPQINMQTGQRDNASDYSYLDLEQHQRRESVDVTTGGKLRNAYRRLADLQGKLAERGMQLKEDAESNRPKSIGEGLSRIWNMPRHKRGEQLPEFSLERGVRNLMEHDPDYRALSHSIREVKEQIRLLENKKYKESHKNGPFDWMKDFGRSAWQGFKDEGKDVLLFGQEELRDAKTRLSINDKLERGEELSDAEENALYDELTTQAIESYVGDLGSAYRWGDMAGRSVAFAGQFLGTGGGFKGLSVFGPRMATRIAQNGAKRLSQDVGESLGMKLARDGVLKFARQGGRDALRKVLSEQGAGRLSSIVATRMLGVGADQLLVRAPMMAGTVQAGQTASKIIDTKLGPVEVDEANGELRYKNDKNWGEATWQTVADQAIENASEMGLTNPLGVKASDITRAFGARNLTAAILRSTREGAGTVLSKTSEFLNRAGIQGYMEEVGEEYSGQAWRTLLGLESAYTQDENGQPVNLFKTGQFHGDTWAGIALSMGLTAGGTAGAHYGVEGTRYLSNAIRKKRMAHRAENASLDASELFGAETWEPMRFAIDATDNADMGKMAEQVMSDGDMTDEQKASVMNYMERVMRMRGQNLRDYVERRDGWPSSEVEQEAVSAYSNGYEATEAEEMQDVKNMLDLQCDKLAGALGISVDEVEERIGPDVTGFAESLRDRDSSLYETAKDYATAQMAYDGMLQRVRDDIDSRIRQSDAMINSRTNRTTGMIQGVTLKVQDDEGNDRRVYVLDGNLATYEDGTGIDKEKSDGSIIIRDAETAAIEMVSPDAIFSVEQPVDPETEKQTAAEAIRQQFAQEAANKIDGTVAFQPGDTYTVTDESGQAAQIQIVPNADGLADNGDGTVNVSSDGGQTVVPMRKDDIQAMVDATNRARVAQVEQQREAMQQPQAQEQPAYSLNDELTLLDENGNEVRGSITADVNEDGQYEVCTESPINGRKVNLFTAEELNRMQANPAENFQQNGEISTENGGNPAESFQQEQSAQQPVQAEQSAMDRIPKDEQGQPLYEQADPDTAWDAIVEQTEGDEAMAQSVADSMVADKEAELKKAEKAKPKGGTTIAEKIAAELERKNAVEQAKANLALWQKIAQTSQRRKQEALAEQLRQAEEAARLRREQEEKERAEREESERILREALNGVPDIIDDTPQDARARGYRRVNGEKIDRQAPLTARQGKEVQVKFNDKNIPSGHVALIEAGQLQPSHIDGRRNPFHFIDEAQPKERNDEASVMSARRIAASIRPEEITSSVTAYTGAPTVNTRGEVIQGNNRSAALREMWAGQPEQSAVYKQYLTEHAADFGLAPEDVEAMQQPVLVNMVDVPDEEAISLGQFVAQDTESGGTERIKPKNIVQKMGGDMRVFANRLLSSPDEEMTFSELVDRNGMDVLKWMQQKSYITPTQYRSAFDSKGGLTAEAKNDLKGVMYQSIFQGGSTHLEEMFNSLPAKAQKAILATAYRDYDSPNSERMNAELQASISVYYALSQMPDFANAKNYKEARMAAEAWKRQLAFDDVTGESYLPAEKYSNFALLLATMYKGQTQTFIQNTFNHIFDLVQGTQETTLFNEPDNTPRTLVKAINETLNSLSEELLLNGNFIYNGQRRNNVLAGSGTTGQPRGQGSPGNAQTGGRAEDGTGTAVDKGRAVQNDDERGGQGYLRHTSGRQPDNIPQEAVSEKVTPIGESDFGFVYDQFRGDAEGAIRQLIKMQDGEALGALHHKDIGDIDLVWGKAGTKKSDGYGLAKLVKFHPEVLDNLQDLLDGMSVTKRSENRIQLEDANYQAAVRLTWNGEEKIWLLTAFKKKETSEPTNSRTDVDSNLNGVSDDTATQHSSDVSDNKDTDKSAVTQTFGEKVAKAEAETDQNPTEAQKEAGNYKKGHVRIGQFNITVENPKGSVRRGMDANGNPWETTMQNTYGYIRGTEGVDGDHIDVFLTNDIDGWNGRRVYVVDQYNEDDTFDEHKVMLGFNEEDEARDAYFSNYSKDWADRHKIVISSTNLEDFEKWINSSHRKTKPFAEYRSVKTNRSNGVDVANGPSVGFEITPEQYTTKRGNVLDMFLVKFAEPLTKEQQRAAKELSKSERGWYDRNNDGFMMRSEESAQKLANTIMGDEEAVNDAQPLSLADMQQGSEPAMRQVDVEGLMRAIYRDGEAKLSDHFVVGKPGLTEKATKPKNSGQFGLVSDERMEELKRRLREKRGQLNSGLDPETLALGIELTAGYLDRGIKKFADYAKVMISELGDFYRPYLKAFYNGARDMPEVQESGLADEMTPYDEVRTFDTANFDKEQGDAMATAEMVVAEQEAYKQSDEAKKKLINKRNEERKSVKRQRKQEEPKIADLFSAQEENAVENQENSPFKKGDAVVYQGKPATVYDIEDNGRPVLDTGLAPVLYESAYPKEVKPANTATHNAENTEINRIFANAVKTDMLAALDSGTKPYRSILDLRKRAAALGMEVDNDGRTDILLQELVEDGLVRAAREVVEQHGRDSRESYDLICKLYDMQPTISARSSNRIKMQQYSTPLPMAWNAARFAMSGKKDGKVLEPTAGNGMLVFAVPANQVHVNELDETRLDNLREQGFAQVTQQDATDPFEGGKQYDVVIANPPFGKREEVEYDGKMIPGLDPQITLNALASMKDNGKAAIIIGGNMEYGNNGGLKSMKPFFTYLYDHYNVKGVVDMDGKLYSKQGTTFPTRMILIAGRRSDEERAQTAVYPPVESKAIRKADSFDDLYDIVNEVINSKEKTNGTEILRSQQGQLVSVADQPSRNTDGKRHTEQSRTDDTSGRGRRASVEGTQKQGEVVLRGEHRADTGNGETRRGTGGNTGGGSRGVPEPDVQRVDRVGVPTDRVGLNIDQKKRTLTEEKLPYRPHNSAFSLESVAPAAMVEAMDNVLSQIEAENGNIDEFVRKELGYETIEETHQALAAEQIDSVAMAIYQMKKGQALIIGDQTGVGKGRQMAALIRWAVKRGEKPIFITQKADLFSDIYRDLVDIGSGDLVPFIFNSPSAKENKGEMVDANGKVVYRGLSDSKMKKVMATGKLPDEYDYAVLTYSQVNSGDEISQKEAEEAAKKRGGRTKKSKASKDGKATPKATFLRAIAEDNYLFLDESHTAAGTSNTGAYLQSILRSAKAATFASATFAKRPDTMPLYAIRTAMSQAKVEPDKLIGIIEKGGVTLQEIMSRELTNAGQMVRRERDMSDVVTDWKTINDPATVKRARENYDRTIAAFNAIIKFQEDYVKPMVDAMDKELAVMAESAGIKRGTDKMGVENVPFASKTYNYTKQLMLALKVDAIANEVDAEIKAGRHPVIALESTMESSIKDYSAGEVISEPTFSASLLRGLDTVMQYTIKDENGKEQHARYTPKQLGEAGEKAYYELQDFIRKSTSDIFISPLDAIIDRLHEMGYKVGELTGRNMYVERDDDGRVVVRRRTDKDKKRMQREFNSGELDVLILNKSASTGISLHASEKFSDQRQRTMIIAQPLSDINDYMQIIGRIDRTGQVHRGYYINLGLPVPAENRFLMMLSTKLKSLNANTTTSQDSESNDVEAPDLLNKYGSQVVVEYLRDNPEIYEKMGGPLKKAGQGGGRVQTNELDEYKPQEDDARKITGYVALLTTKEQEEFYDDVVRRYNELIKYLNDTGNNDLKITVMPLRAKTLNKRVSSEGIDPTGTNPFARNSYVEQVEMDVLRKPMKAAEIRKTIEQVNKGKRPEDYVRQIIATIDKEDEARIATEEARYERSKVRAQEDIAKQTEKINRQQKRTAEEKQAAIADYARETNENVETKHNDNMVRLNANSDMLKQRLHMFEVGKSYLMPDNLESMVFDFSTPAIFCGYKAKDSKITASTTLAVFATLDGRRRMEIKLSQPEALRSIYKTTNDNWDAARSTTLENWDSQIPTGTRKTGFIMTGNILQAIADTQDEHGGYPGQLISYTDIDGNVHDGILMPDKWNTSMLKTSGAPIVSRLKQIKDYMPVTSHDGKVDITGSSWAKVYYLTVPKTKKDGAIYYENKVLLRAVNGSNFYPYRGKLRADIPEENIEKVVRELSKLGVKVKEDANEDDVLYRNGEGTLTDDELSLSNDPAAKMTGRQARTAAQRRAFAERERQRMVNAVQKLAETLHLDNVDIVTDASTLQGRRAKAKGFYSRGTGRITIVIPNHTSVYDVEQTLLHEAVAHYGLRQLFGEHFDTFLDNVFQNADTDVRRHIVELAERRGWDFRTATEEYLASLAENTNFENVNASWWSKIKELFLRMLHKIGFENFSGVTLSDNELRYILWRSYENLAEPGRYRSILGGAEDVAKQNELKVGNYAPNTEEAARNVAERSVEPMVNERFNDQLAELTEENADRIALSLGRPSAVLRAAGVEEIPMKLYGAKILKKIKKHGFALDELRDLPRAVADPIAVFNNYQKDGNRAILTELQTAKGNFLVTLDLGKGEDVDFNIISSVFGKGNDNIVDWIERGLATYINKEKVLNYLHHSALRAEALSSPRLISAANIVRNFENPTVSDGKVRAVTDNVLYRDGDTETLRQRYDNAVRTPNKSRSVKWYENIPARLKESYVDSMRALNVLMKLISEETGNEIKGFEDAYKAENRMSSENKGQKEVYNRDFYKPMIEAIMNLIRNGANYEEIKRYAIARHGLERNQDMAERDAERDYEAIQKAHPHSKKTLQDFIDKYRKKDYSGLTSLTGTDNVSDAEAAARQLVSDFERKHDTAVLWDKINAATKETLRKSYDSGLMDKATYDKVRNMYQYYIPLRGWDCDVASNEYDYLMSGNHLMLSPVLQTAKGRTSLADDPFAVIGFMAESSIIQGTRNRMKQKFFNFVLNNPTDLVTVSEQWYVLDNATGKWEPRNPVIPENATGDEVDAILKQHEQEMEALGDKATKKRSGLQLDMHITKREGQEHVVKVKRGGKEYCLYINGNPKAAQALNGVTNPDVSDSKLRKAAQAVKNFMAQMFTSKNPTFIFRNLTMDVMWAGTAVSIKENRDYVNKYTNNISRAMLKAQLPRLLAKFQNGTLDKDVEIERYFDEFIRNGGETGFTQLNTVENYKRDIKRFVKEAQGRRNIPKKAWDGFWDGIEFMNRSSEDTTRFMVYMTSRQMGRDVARSVWDAKEITVNFNKKGSGGLGADVMNFCYIFFNAAIQSMANFGRLMYHHPVKTMTALTLFASAGFLVPMMNIALISAFGGDDDDDENNYWDLPEWVRRSNIVLYLPFSEKGFITIPLSHELRPFYGMGEIAFSCLMGKESPEEALKKAAAGFSGMSPIDLTGNGGNITVSMTPTIGQPFAQIVANTDYFGKPIYRRNSWNELDPEWSKAYKGTSAWLVDGTKWLNELTGGDNVKSGVLDWNPAIIEHLFEGYFGGMAKTLNKSQKTLEMLWNEDMREWRNVPVMSSFYQDGDERTAGSQLNREYYEAVSEMKETEHLFSGYKKQLRMGALEYAEKLDELVHSEVFKRYRLVKGYDNAIRKLTQAMERVDPAERKDVETAILNLKVEMFEKLEELNKLEESATRK